MPRRKPLVLTTAEWAPIRGEAFERIKTAVGEFRLAQQELYQHLCDGTLPAAGKSIGEDGRIEARLIERQEWHDDPTMLSRMLYVAMPRIIGFIRRACLDKHYPTGSAGAPTPREASEATTPRRRRGPATTHEWHAIDGEIARRCHDQSGRIAVPKNESKLAKAMLDWCQDRYGREPAESEMREAVKNICAALRKVSSQ